MLGAPGEKSGRVNPKALIEYYKTMFDSIDTDKSGYIDRQELALLAEAIGRDMSETDLNAAMRDMDQDGSGEIEFDEFFSWFSDAMENDTMTREAFDRADADGSGAIDREEVREVMKELGQKVGKRELDMAMREMDDDNSGEVSFEEFREWWDRQTALAILANSGGGPDPQEVYLRKQFDTADGDASGAIDCAELETLLETLGRPLAGPELNIAFAIMDEDSSGEIEWFEFKHWFAWLQKEDLSLCRIFNEVDKDGSGSLDRDEVAWIIDHLNSNATRGDLHIELDEAMKAMDADESGEVDKVEFSDWWTRHHLKGTEEAKDAYMRQLNADHYNTGVKANERDLDKPVMIDEEDTARLQKAALSIQSSFRTKNVKKKVKTMMMFNSAANEQTLAREGDWKRGRTKVSMDLQMHALGALSKPDVSASSANEEGEKEEKSDDDEDDDEEDNEDDVPVNVRPSGKDAGAAFDEEIEQMLKDTAKLAEDHPEEGAGFWSLCDRFRVNKLGLVPAVLQQAITALTLEDIYSGIDTCRASEAANIWEIVHFDAKTPDGPALEALNEAAREQLLQHTKVQPDGFEDMLLELDLTELQLMARRLASEMDELAPTNPTNEALQADAVALELMVHVAECQLHKHQTTLRKELRGRKKFRKQVNLMKMMMGIAAHASGQDEREAERIVNEREAQRLAQKEAKADLKAKQMERHAAAMKLADAEQRASEGAAAAARSSEDAQEAAEAAAALAADMQAAGSPTRNREAAEAAAEAAAQTAAQAATDAAAAATKAAEKQAIAKAENARAVNIEIAVAEQVAAMKAEAAARKSADQKAGFAAMKGSSHTAAPPRASKLSKDPYARQGDPYAASVMGDLDPNGYTQSVVSNTRPGRNHKQAPAMMSAFPSSNLDTTLGRAAQHVPHPPSPAPSNTDSDLWSQPSFPDLRRHATRNRPGSAVRYHDDGSVRVASPTGSVASNDSDATILSFSSVTEVERRARDDRRYIQKLPGSGRPMTPSLVPTFDLLQLLGRRAEEQKLNAAGPSQLHGLMKEKVRWYDGPQLAQGVGARPAANGGALLHSAAGGGSSIVAPLTKPQQKRMQRAQRQDNAAWKNRKLDEVNGGVGMYENHRSSIGGTAMVQPTLSSARGVAGEMMSDPMGRRGTAANARNGHGGGGAHSARELGRGAPGRTVNWDVDQPAKYGAQLKAIQSFNGRQRHVPELDKTTVAALRQTAACAGAVDWTGKRSRDEDARAITEIKNLAAMPLRPPIGGVQFSGPPAKPFKLTKKNKIFGPIRPPSPARQPLPTPRHNADAMHGLLDVFPDGTQIAGRVEAMARAERKRMQSTRKA